MDKKDIEKYLKRLQEIDNTLNDDNDLTSEMESDINNILQDLTKIGTPEITDSALLNVNYKKLSPTAIEPSYSTDGDAGLDFRVDSIINEDAFRLTYGTGIALEIPKGYVGLLFPRSSIKKYNLSLSNWVGVIDQTYRGEIMAVFNKINNNVTKYEIGDKFVQMIIIPYPTVKLKQVEELSDTVRGDKGYGSSGR